MREMRETILKLATQRDDLRDRLARIEVIADAVKSTTYAWEVCDEIIAIAREGLASWAGTVGRGQMSWMTYDEAGELALRLLADLERAEAERDALKAEVARLRDIISPGDGAAYEEGMAALQARLASEHESLVEVCVHVNDLKAKLARVVEIAEGWGHGLGCDAYGCWIDPDRRCTCGLRGALAAAKGEP